MKYSFRSRIRFSEVDENGKLSITSLINYFQDCTLFFSEDNGLGMNYLAEQKRAWFLGSWQILIRELPTFGEEVQITTWACGFKRFSGQRNFTLTAADGRMLACAFSNWAFMDLDKGIPIVPDEAEIVKYGVEPPLEENFGERRIRLKAEGSEQPSFTIHRYHLDTNHHVNNAQYIALAQEYLTPGFSIGRIRAEYKTAAVLDSLVTPVVYETLDGIAVSLNQENGKPYAIVEFQKTL